MRFAGPRFSIFSGAPRPDGYDFKHNAPAAVAEKVWTLGAGRLRLSKGGNWELMQYNKELPRPRPQSFEQFRSARPAESKSQVPPQITIRGDNNLINFGTSGVVRVNAGGTVDSGLQPARNGQWPQQLLDAIRLKAAKTRCSNDEVCELASRVLGRAVVTLDRLSARELARVYEAVCASERKA